MKGIKARISISRESDIDVRLDRGGSRSGIFLPCTTLIPHVTILFARGKFFMIRKIDSFGHFVYLPQQQDHIT